MARKKRLRFASLGDMANVVDGRRSPPGWFARAFGRERTVVLELGCGRGEYTLALARRRPHQGVLGVDRNGARLWKGADQAREEGLTNAVFLRLPIEYLDEHVPPASVHEIWVPFPDPLPKNRQAKHRLVSPAFLHRYRQLLCPGGVIHLKTDNRPLVEFAEEAVRAVGGRLLASTDALDEAGASLDLVETTYEKRYRQEGRAIYTRRFSLEQQAPNRD